MSGKLASSAKVFCASMNDYVLTDFGVGDASHVASTRDAAELDVRQRANRIVIQPTNDHSRYS
jgi:hypothetical protein